MLNVDATRFSCLVCWLLRSCILLSDKERLAGAEMAWTPIYMGDSSQVDLWTRSTSGCPCTFNSSRIDCACCVQSGGCGCGVSSPHRCAQCGLEQHCANVCNMTLDSRILLEKSGRAFGQIKSPALAGPTRCTYTFVPDTGQRVELQIYRLVSIGKHNGSTCVGGWLQFEGGARVCGQNERFTPPVVLFSDKDVATLRMEISGKTSRSQFLAYFSFTSKTSTSVGWPARGGKAENNTACDWVYEDSECQAGCVLASPGYPGIYAANTRCLYLVTSGPRMSATITFTAVLLPDNHCITDYIAVYSGKTTGSPLLRTICGNESTTLTHTGPNLLVEFRSGPGLPSYDYNGFVASLRFTEITTEAPTTTTTMGTTTKMIEIEHRTSVNHGGISYIDENLHGYRTKEPRPLTCELEARGEESRSGNHDTRGKPKSTICRLILRGGSYDSVHVSLTSFNLSALACRSSIEIFDGPPEGGSGGSGRSLQKICSPAQRISPRPSDSIERYAKHEKYSATGRELTVVLRRASNTPRDEEYMEVAYYFHDEREEGTQQPASECDVEYFGLSSPKNGSVGHPAPHKLTEATGPLTCKQHFIPAANQSVIITMENTTAKQSSMTSCRTECGDNGCHCSTDKNLEDIDHLQVVSETGHVIGCLCGSYQDWLPIGVRSWKPVYIEWSRSANAGLHFRASYKFIEDSYCGDHSTKELEGEVISGELAMKLNNYYQQRCTWTLDSNTDRQLIIEVNSNQSRPCTAWNLTIHEYSYQGDPAGARLHTFCSRDGHKIFTLPWKMNTAVVRLQALSRTAPQYVLRWKSETILARKSGPSPAPNQVTGSTSRCSKPSVILLTLFFVGASTINANRLTAVRSIRFLG